MAQWIGLDRLESLRAIYPEWAAKSDDELADWRLVWWCVYRLDSYTNFAAGTPYLIDETLICTAVRSDGMLMLPNDPDDLPALIERLFPDDGDNNDKDDDDDDDDDHDEVEGEDRGEMSLFAVHHVSVACLRSIGRVIRCEVVKAGVAPSAFTPAPTPQQATVVFQARDLKRRLLRMRQALPPDFFDPVRHEDESPATHRERLVINFQLHICRLLILIVGCAKWTGEEWRTGWRQVLETCRELAAVAEQWTAGGSGAGAGAGNFLGSDPAVALIMFMTLVFLDLQKKTSASFASALEERGFRKSVERCEEVVLELMEGFASVWALPRLLIREFFPILLSFELVLGL
jgi:hypothetical protein